ncbi:MAG: reverse transcriptase domain-containing protein [Terriglobia bacterium]|nr:reverse transcriptase domain-containing protein [Terriglobia bacterium]
MNQHSHAVLSAMESKDDEKFTRAVVRLLQIPSIVLSIPQSGHLGVFKHRMRTLLAGDIVEANGLLERNPKPFEDARFVAAQRFIAAKEPSRAIKALLRQPLADIKSPIIQAKLLSLHPPRKPGDILPSLIDEKDPPPPCIITPSDVKSMISGFPRKSGAGPSGWTFEMIRDACANDETNTIMFAKLFTRIANGDIPAKLTPYLLVAYLLPAGKENNGVRPITIGEVFYRAVCSRVVSVVGPAMVKWFWPIQAGVAVKAGAEIQVHRVQALVEKGASSAKFDSTNAFNTIRRLIFFNVVKSMPEMNPAKRLIEWAYRNSSLLFAMSDGQIELQILSEEGSRQGCPLGSLLFCCGTQPTLQRLQSAHPDVTITAFIDDVKATSKLKLLPPICEDLKREFADIGLQVNTDKCEVLINQPAEDSKELAWFEKQGIKHGASAVKYLGAGIGTDPAARAAILQATVAKHRPLFAALADARLTRQESTYLARQCVNHKLSYLIAVSPPAISAPIAQEFDAQLRKAICSRLNTELVGKALEQARLPVAMGGLGLRSAQWLAPIAFLASHARAAKAMESIDIQGTATMQGLTESLAAIKMMVSDSVKRTLPSDAAVLHHHFASHPHPELQHVLTADAEKMVFNRLVAQASSPHDQARIKAASADKASLCLTAAPTSETRLDDSSFQLKVRHTLGLRPAEILPMRCRFCAHANGDLQTNPWHPLSCPRIAGTKGTGRHNEVVQVLAGWITKLGGYVRIEQPLRLTTVQGEQEIIPDIDAQLGGSRYLIDVSIADPTCPSHVNKGAKEPLAVAAEVERKKHDIYRDLANQIRPKPVVVPFVIESYGGFGVEATEFVKRLITQAATMASVWQPAEFVHSIFWSISCAVQRWNSRIMRDALCGTDSASGRFGAHRRKHSSDTEDKESNGQRQHPAAQEPESMASEPAVNQEPMGQFERQHRPKPRVDVKQFSKPTAVTAARNRAARKAHSGRELRNELVERKRSQEPGNQPQQAAPAPRSQPQPRQQTVQEQQREDALQKERARFTKWAEEKRNQEQHRAEPAARQAASTPSSTAPPAPKTRELQLSERGRQEVQEIMDKQQLQAQQIEERLQLQRIVGPIIQRRFGRMSYVQLCNAFNPDSCLTNKATKDELRKMLKKTMVRYHPDRTLGLAMRQRIEAEEIFELLQERYQELCK